MKTIKTNQKTKLLFLAAIVAIMLITVAKNAFTDGSVTQQVYGDSTLVEFEIYSTDNRTTFSLNLEEEDRFVDMVVVSLAKEDSLSHYVYKTIEPDVQFEFDESLKEAIVFFRTENGVTSVKFIEDKKYMLLNGRVSCVRTGGGAYVAVPKNSSDLDRYKETNWQWDKFENRVTL